MYLFFHRTAHTDIVSKTQHDSTSYKTPSSSSIDPSSTLLRLPLELRQQIYAYLLPRGNITHPLPSVGITSISHRLPSTILLNIHPTITAELLDYFYAITTWKLIFSHAFNFFRVDPNLENLEKIATLRHLRKVEIVFFCDILLLKEYPSFGLQDFCTEIKRRCQRACSVLTKAERLSSVTVSWIDTTLTGGWEEKATILQPLLQLGPEVTFRIGEISGPTEVDRGRFVKAMQDVLGEGRKLEIGFEGVSEEDRPTRLRMLAFDPRQERRRLQQGEVVGQHFGKAGEERVMSSYQRMWQHLGGREAADAEAARW
ncbi:hypothetical protein LTR03_002042 [Friedmanniomyces endolithicus]|nr:hypothetical protein LTR03_002042 [Friedmanniomyces endolithicus]